MTGQERSVHLSVPERGDPDRKRVLNILAQRRYRIDPLSHITVINALHPLSCFICCVITGG